MRPAINPIVEAEHTERLARQLAPAIECGSGGLPRNYKGEPWTLVDGGWVKTERLNAMRAANPTGSIVAQSDRSGKDSANMALRGKKPETIKKRLKAMFMGGPGAGKTTALLGFGRVYLIDTERGAENDQYVRALAAGGGAYFPTYDFDEMVQEVHSLMTTKHEFNTLGIDPLTVVYNDLLDKAEKKVGNEFGRHYAEANKRMKHLLNLLLRLDMNVIVTCHSKNEYGQDMKVIGTTFDGYKKLDYLFDLVIEVQKRGKERVGVVKKTRLEAFIDGEVFPFNYDNIADRYGRDVLERTAATEVLATAAQIAEITRLVELLKVPSETTEKWLDKAKAETWEEMPSDAIAKCIASLTQKLTGQAA